MSNGNYTPGFRDRLDRMRALRERGHTDACATSQAYSETRCSCHVDCAKPTAPSRAGAREGGGRRCQTEAIRCV
jgi:hypothetical protein